MEYSCIENKIILKGQNNFDIKQILECGQSFRFEEKENGEFSIVAHGKIINISQNLEEITFYPCDKNEFEKIWIKYFDLERDYNKIKSVICENDDVMKKAVEYGSGIRILCQDRWEILITFIISQNNRIPMIKNAIKNISEKYGDKIDEKNFAFPSCAQMINANEEELMGCKVGFRAKYILDAIDKIYKGAINLETLEQLELFEIREKLLTIKGVGPKVCDCIILFGFSRYEAFPVDVWIKRVMEYFYFDKQDTNIKIIEKFGFEKFNKYGGFAQQYLFYMAREEKIGKK